MSEELNLDENIDSLKEEEVEETSDIETKDEAEEIQEAFQIFLGKHYEEVDRLDSPKIVIPTGLNLLDAISGGGFGMNFVQLVGNPGCAKSTLAACVLAQGQKRHKPKFIGMYFDSEQSTDKKRLYELGVRNPPIVPYDHRITVEKIVKSVDGMCVFKKNHPELMDIPSMIVWDSVANTTTEKGYEADNADSVLGQKARLLSFYLPKITDLLSEYNICLVAVNQLREKIDMGIFKTANDLKYLGGNSVIPGGKSLIFNSFQLYLLKHEKDVNEYGFQGAIIKIKTVKNKLFTPNLTIKLVMSFQKGFSNFWSNWEFLKETKRAKASAWCTLENYPTKKFRQFQAIEFYRDDPKFKEAWDESVADAIKVEIIEKTNTLDENVEVS